MKKQIQGLISEAISKATQLAVQGSKDKLFDLLCRNSGLPGVRPNHKLATGFAEECALLGSQADKLLFSMVLLDAEEAPGDNEREFLPYCGVLGVGARGARDAKFREKAIKVVHDACDDFRFRVRDAASFALTWIAEKDASRFVLESQAFTDGYFHATAVLKALSEPSVFVGFKEADTEELCLRLDETLRLIKDANRSDSRYPGYKSLLEECGVAFGKIAEHVGAPVFDVLRPYLKMKHPDLREVLPRNFKRERLVGRYPDLILEMNQIIKESTPEKRDSKGYGTGKTRGRGRS